MYLPIYLSVYLSFCPAIRPSVSSSPSLSWLFSCLCPNAFSWLSCHWPHWGLYCPEFAWKATAATREYRASVWLAGGDNTVGLICVKRIHKRTPTIHYSNLSRYAALIMQPVLPFNVQTQEHKVISPEVTHLSLSPCSCINIAILWLTVHKRSLFRIS